jgi:hypothetical protein
MADALSSIFIFSPPISSDIQWNFRRHGRVKPIMGTLIDNGTYRQSASANVQWWPLLAPLIFPAAGVLLTQLRHKSFRVIERTQKNMVEYYGTF